MQLLIVDDEILAVEGLKCLVDWQEMNITKIFTAYNAYEAKAVLKSEAVDIVISDIEMPVENGLDLLKWMRENGCQAENIFLTCHESFSYAREALMLGSSDYLLKPVDSEALRQAICKVLKTLDQKHGEAVRRRYYEKMKANKSVLDHIWFCNLVKGKLEASEEEVLKQCHENGLQLQSQDRLMFIYFVIKKVEEPFQSWETAIYDFAFVNIATECLDLGESEKVFSFSGANRHSNTYGGLVLEKHHSLDETAANCKRFISWMEKQYRTSIACYIDDFSNISEIRLQTERLLKIDGKNQWGDALVFICKSRPELNAFRTNSLKSLDSLWQEGNAEQILEQESENGKAPVSEMDSASIVAQVKKYIAQHIAQEITRGDLSEHVHLNRDYLNRLFKKETGKSLTEYITDEKMNIAKELLVMTDMPVGEIGYCVGYGNFSYFSAYFKKNTGHSPASYRQQHRVDG